MNARFLFICLGLFLLLAGCDHPRDRIVGKWRVTPGENALIWEFSPNGRVKAGKIEGRYSFGDSQKLKTQTPSATFIYVLDLKENKMVWTAANGVKTELERLP